MSTQDFSALYFGHIQGELKSFYELFQIIVASQEPLLFSIEGTLGQNQFLHFENV